MCAQLSVAAAAVVHDADFVVAAANGEDAQTRGGPKYEPGSRGFAAVDDGPLGVVS